MNPARFLARLRNPQTRWEALRTLLVGVSIASGSIGGTMIGTQSALGFYAVLMERFQFPMIRSEIESLRRDIGSISCGSAAMLVAQAADWNRRIEHEHESNRHIYSDWASTDRWLQVERIEIPCGEKP